MHYHDPLQLMKKVVLFLFLIFFIISNKLFSQQNSLRYEIEAITTATNDAGVPFWLRANQFGSMPLSGPSASFLGRATKDFDSEMSYQPHPQRKLIDWGAGIEARANIGGDSDLRLIEAYGKLRVGIFQLKAGRSKDVMGFSGDTALSSGNFSVSGNSLGIPKFEVAIPEYWAVPFLNNLVAIKGNISHGWLGTLPVLDTILKRTDGTFETSNVEKAKSYFHQKSFYARLGHDDWKVKFFGGFNHQVFWGSERDIYGESFQLSPAGTFLHVLTGKSYGNTKIPRSKIGNHLGSIDFGVELDFPEVTLMAYRQNFYDVGALSKLANIKDGLNGVSLVNKAFSEQTKNIRWNRILFEFLYTKHQAGEFGSKITKSGDEDYYNNYFYTQGWSYRGEGIGNPLLTPKHYAREGLPSHRLDYFINNRVVAFHAGILGYVYGWAVFLKATYSENYGTFGTSSEGKSTGEIIAPEPVYGLFGKKSQFSGIIQVQKALNQSLSIGIAAAVDQGDVLYNSTAVQASLLKRF